MRHLETLPRHQTKAPAGGAEGWRLATSLTRVDKGDEAIALFGVGLLFGACLLRNALADGVFCLKSQIFSPRWAARLFFE